ncbi:heparinase II/III-family protein [bacterium]|nr:heparinase II/III-family protein [bacterium]
MVEFSLYCIKPDGRVPQIGDNDSGRFLIFSKRLILEHKYLLTLAAIYYKNSEFKVPILYYDEEAFWFFGKAGKEFFDALSFRREPITSKGFSHAGWHIIRYDNDYCFISCGPNGQRGRGGHAHNDKLSFELVIDGYDIIVDPGTYVYTPYPEERNKFRSTDYHNGIKFNGFEQNEIIENEVFDIVDRVKIKDAELKETYDNLIFQGIIEYLHFSHKRTICLYKKDCRWQIIDSISSLEPVKAQLKFHLSPHVFYNNGGLFFGEGGKRIASIATERHELAKGYYDYSPEYGVKKKAEYLMADISVGKKTETIITNIYREG